MNVLLITAPVYPSRGNNANLIWKLLPFFMQKHTVHILSCALSSKKSELPGSIDGIPVHWVTDEQRNFTRRYIYPLVSKLTDPHGYSDAIQVMLIAKRLKELYGEYPFDMIISTMEPYPSACAAIQMPGNIRKVLYLMDPPACTYDPSVVTPYRARMLPKVLAGHDLILTTPFIRKALSEQGYGKYDHKIAEVGFPMIESHTYQPYENDVVMDHGKINLLFCGWLYSDIRSPKYFLDIVSCLDERFCVYFMGRECDKLHERFEVNTKAQIVALPNQPYQTALNAMHDADILINIGNSVPVHMPSKTLEYINTGKPIVNFYKMEDCTTLYYTNRYPLCLNLPEYDPDVDAAAEKFVKFCVENKGKTIDTSGLAEEFRDCTPEYIANAILEHLGANND